VRVQCVIQQGTDRSMRTVHAPTRRRRSSKPCMWLQAHHHPWGLAVGCPVATCCSCAGPVRACVRACACVRAWMPIHLTLTPRPRTATTPCWCRRRSARAVAAATLIHTPKVVVVRSSIISCAADVRRRRRSPLDLSIIILLSYVCILLRTLASDDSD
jgi:hypothetical protein